MLTNCSGLRLLIVVYRSTVFVKTVSDSESTFSFPYVLFVTKVTVTVTVII